MITCNQCGFEQDEGKFCGKCGNLLKENVQAEVDQQHIKQQVETAAGLDNAAPVRTNDSMEKVKQKSKAFGNYFKFYVKKPALIFSKKEDEFTNGMISVVIVSILMALSVYTLIGNLMRSPFGFGDYSPPFLTIFGNVLFFSLAVIAIIVSILFLINSVFGSDYSYKQMISVFGAHLVPVIIVAGVSFLLLIIKSNTLGSILLGVTLVLILTTIPVYLISSLLTRNSKGVDPLYGYILYLIAIGIAFVLFFSMLADSTIGNIWDELSYYLP